MPCAPLPHALQPLQQVGGHAPSAAAAISYLAPPLGRWSRPTTTPCPQPPKPPNCAAAVTEEGTPWLSYTAAATFVPELGNFFQTQALASPVDPGDRMLRVWRKAAANPVLVQTPPGGTNFQACVVPACIRLSFPALGQQHGSLPKTPGEDTPLPNARP